MAAHSTKRRRKGLRGLTTASRPGVAADRLDNIKADALKVGLIAATGSLIVAGLMLSKGAIKRAVADSKEENAIQQVTTTNSPSYHAERLRAAFNPSGIEWLRDTDTTDVTGVMNVARAIRTRNDMVKVGQAYQAMTRRRLLDDFRSELSPSEGQQFWSIIGKKPKK